VSFEKCEEFPVEANAGFEDFRAVSGVGIDLDGLGAGGEPFQAAGALTEITGSPFALIPGGFPIAVTLTGTIQ